jgi:Fe-S cluster assembly scaffold protein SufB
MPDVKTVIVRANSSSQEPLRIKSESGIRRVNIQAEDHARACIVHEVETPQEIHVTLGEGSTIEFISVNRAAGNITISQRSILADNATIRWRNVTLAAGTVDHDLRSELTGVDAVSEVDWMFYAKNEEHYRLTARNVYKGKNGGGEIVMKGVAEGRGYVECDGMLEIQAQANGAKTYLTQDVLMLDATAKVDAIPRLEIKTNDVKASQLPLIELKAQKLGIGDNCCRCFKFRDWL